MIGMLMKTRFGAAVLIALSSGLVPAALAAPKFATNVVSQLPRSARPLHYQIRVTPDAKSLRFSGTVKIDIELLIASSSLTLNAADLELASAQILRRGPPRAPQRSAMTAPAKPSRSILDRRCQSANTRLKSRIAGRSTARPMACSRLITAIRKARINARCSPSSKPPTRGVLCRAGMSPISGQALR